MSTENCQWDDWGPWQWNDQVEVDGEMTKCGNGMRTRGEKKPAKHGGLNCTGPREVTDVKPCPLGMNIIQKHFMYMLLFSGIDSYLCNI